MNFHDLLKVCYALTLLAMGSKDHEKIDSILIETAKQFYGDFPALKSLIEAYVKGEEVNLEGFGAQLQAKVKKDFLKEPTLRPGEHAQFRAFQMWFRTNSESAYRTIEKNSSQIDLPWVASFFAKEVGTQAPAKKALLKIVQKLTGKSDIAFDSIEEAKALKEKYPDVYSEYLRLRQDFNKTWKSALNTFVRTSGQKHVPIKEALDFLKKNCLDHTMPTGFVGRVDADGSWYTEEGKKLSGVPLSTMFPSVRMNPKRDEDDPWVFQAMGKDGKKGGHFYTIEYQQQSSKAKFDAVRKLYDTMPSIRSKWLNKIKTFDPNQMEDVAAVVIEMLYAFSARIGSPTRSTFGMSTIQLKHVTDRDTSLLISYKGKDSVPTKHVLLGDTVLNKRLIKIIRGLMADKKPSDPVFTYPLKNGTFRIVQNGFINAQFKAYTGINDKKITVHKLRTYHASKMAMELIEELKEKRKVFGSSKDLMALLVKIAEKVGKKLNHVRRTKEGGTTVTGATALKNYIDSGLQVDLFQHYSLPLPPYLDKLVKGPDS